jgi:hypothetical protein
LNPRSSDAVEGCTATVPALTEDERRRTIWT